MILLGVLVWSRFAKARIAALILENESGAREDAARMEMTVLSEQEVLWALFRAALMLF